MSRYLRISERNYLNVDVIKEIEIWTDIIRITTKDGAKYEVIDEFVWDVVWFVKQSLITCETK